MTSQPERETLIHLINEAEENGARLEVACDTACITLRTYYRWFRDNQAKSDQHSEVQRPTPKNKLSEDERQYILEVCNLPEYANLINQLDTHFLFSSSSAHHSELRFKCKILGSATKIE